MFGGGGKDKISFSTGKKIPFLGEGAVGIKYETLLRR
jgi:hypothetical protein